MRLWILSDIHLELQDEIPLPPPDADVAVLAGDITAPLEAAFAWAVDRISEHMPVVLVPGNHEFYRDSVSGGIYRGLKAYARDPRVHLLVNDCVVLDGVRFIGGTLWTDYALDASRTSPAARDSDIAWAMRNAEGLLQDHQQIARDDNSWVRWSPVDARAAHQVARTYIETVLEVPHDGPTVVVTHHAPAPLSISPHFLGSQLNPAFASDLSAAIMRYRPDLWIHGHVHHSVEYVLGKTQVVCNPRGYEGENPDFDPALVLDIFRRQ
ncbi:metallophosphoesterase [Microvirga sp. P5_D2]